MPHTRAPHPQPLVLVATRDPRQRLELADLLASGFRITIAHDQQELLAHTQTQPPDAIVLDSGVGPPGYGLCTTLRTFSLATPIVLIIPGAVTPANEHEALRAGAWAVLGTPTDPDALLLRLEVFVEPKRELERVSDECLFDRVSGLYNHSGLTRRAAELAALATRQGFALACAVFRPIAQLPNHFAGDRLARAFKSVGRVSDALGRTGPAEFAVFAPASDGAAARLVRRLSDNVERAFGGLREGPRHIGVRFGYSTAPPAQRISPAHLLEQARRALETSAL